MNWEDADSPTGEYLIATGDAPQFKFTITNTGNVPLDFTPGTGNATLSLTDSDFQTLVDAETLPTSLAVDATADVIITATWAAGQHTNTGTVEIVYTDDDGNTETENDSDNANYFGADPDIDIEKYVSIDGGVNWEDADSPTGEYLIATGDAPRFKFTITNTGNVPLDFEGEGQNATLSLTDSDFQTLVDAETLPTGLAVDATADVIITATWAAGQHTNTGTVEIVYTDDDGNTETENDSDNANYFGADPDIDIEKYVSIDGGVNWEDADSPTGEYLIATGDAPQFKFTITNTGNVPLDFTPGTGNATLSLTDSDFQTLVDAETLPTSLAVDATADVIITATWAAGQHTNTGTVEIVYTDDDGNTETENDSDNANYFGADPDIDIEKYVSIDGGVNWEDADSPTGEYLIATGDAPQFKFTITNTGNVPLDFTPGTGNATLSLTDSDFQTLVDAETLPTSLAVDATADVIITATWAAGQHTNTGTVEIVYTDDDGNTETENDSDNANYFGADPDIDIEKYVSIDGGVNWEDADSPAGEYLIATGDAPRFKFTITNTGNVPLDFEGEGQNATLSLTDSDFQTLVDAETLPTGLAVDATADVIITATWAAGQHTNTGTVEIVYTDDDGNTETENDSDNANYFGTSPDIDIEKYVSIDGGVNWEDADSPTGEYLIATGDAPQFKFTITNTGNVPLDFEGEGQNATLSLTDSDFQTLVDAETLPTGLAVDATADVIITATWAAGQHTNTGTVEIVYTDDDGNTETENDSDNANYFGADPDIDIEKYVSIDGGVNWEDADSPTGEYLIATGDAPQFKFTITNTGNVPLDFTPGTGNATLSLTDSDFQTLVDAETLPTSLAVDATADVIITATWAAGQHTNTGTVEIVYTDDDGNTETENDSDNANYFGADPDIDIEKYVSIDGGVNWEDADSPTGEYLIATGDAPRFKFTITNTGNVPLDFEGEGQNATLSLTDSDFQTLVDAETPPTGLAVDATADVIITATWAAGQHTNTGTVEIVYTDDDGNTETENDSDNANYFGATPTSTSRSMSRSTVG